jgi:hypothetical protein
MILRPVPAAALLLVGPPMPDRSKVMTQTKKNTPVLHVGSWSMTVTTSPPCKKNSLLRSPIMDVRWIILVKDQGEVIRDYDFYGPAWNILSLYTAGMLKQVKT